MTLFVLDTSALLARLWKEPGEARIAHLLTTERCLVRVFHCAADGGDIEIHRPEIGIIPPHVQAFIWVSQRWPRHDERYAAFQHPAAPATERPCLPPKSLMRASC